ncbi:MAG: hypothetical protein JNM99_14745 [Verrucomicrobiaceae bacterium]|nr:hypothetical protein [Verrucomicrobiaceae bacterium]
MKTEDDLECRSIIARSITLRDAQGNCRIHMDAEMAPNLSIIAIYGEEGDAVSITIDPQRAITLSFTKDGGIKRLSLGIDASGRVGLVSFDGKERHLFPEKTAGELGQMGASNLDKTPSKPPAKP